MIQFLPLADVCTWRCVNRHWRAVVSMMERLDSWAGQQTTAVIVSGWKRSSFLRDLPPQMRLSSLHLNPPRAGLPKFLGLEACATSRGLICFRERWDSRLFICNPLTRVWRQLPHVTEIDRHCLDEEIHLITDTNSGSFKVFRISQVFGHKQVRFMYDSLSGAWSPVDQPPSMFQNDRSIRVLHDGLLMHFHSAGSAVVGLDVNEGVYKKCSTHPGISYSPSAVVEHMGFLYYIGLSTVTKVCHMHKLCAVTGHWDELDASSLEWTQPSCKGDYRIQVAACSTYICISLLRRCSNQCVGCKGPASRMAAFDVSANSWSCWGEDQSFSRSSLLSFELSFRGV